MIILGSLELESAFCDFLLVLIELFCLLLRLRRYEQI